MNDHETNTFGVLLLYLAIAAGIMAGLFGMIG